MIIDFINYLNTSPFFYAIVMLLLNLGSKYVDNLRFHFSMHCVVLFSFCRGTLEVA